MGILIDIAIRLREEGAEGSPLAAVIAELDSGLNLIH